MPISVDGYVVCLFTGPAQSDLTFLNQSNLTQPNLVWPDYRPNLIWFNLFCPDLLTETIYHDPIWPDSIQPNLIWLETIWADIIPPNSIWTKIMQPLPTHLTHYEMEKISWLTVTQSMLVRMSGRRVTLIKWLSKEDWQLHKICLNKDSCLEGRKKKRGKTI